MRERSMDDDTQDPQPVTGTGGIVITKPGASSGQ
jgi:hypothetical protein